MSNLLPLAPDGTFTRSSGARHAWTVLAMLTAAQVLSFMDRFLLNILGQPIKEDLHLTDWQLGLLNGLAFAASYTIVGVPLARLAERRNRVGVIVGCILVWSGMTMMCGLAASLWQLMLLRMGVGVGEAGAVPASHSLITDYFPPRRRASALAVLGVGIPLGALLGSTLGGSLADASGWRHAFVMLGAPGVVVALLVGLLIREVPRGRLDPIDKRVAAAEPPPSFKATIQLLWRSPTARQIMFELISV
jgi:MFS family permease